MTIPDHRTEVHRSVTVPLSPQRAFTLFTGRMGAFWPAGHSIGTAPIDDVVIEPRAGGRWYERGVDGSECDWGRVASWEPFTRIVLVWQVGADWTRDPGLETDVEVTFREQEPGRTRVDLVHRHLERYLDATATMRAVFDSPGGWNGILAGFLDAATGPPAGPVDDYRRAQDCFESVLAALPAPVRDGPTACPDWTVRDVVGHVTWGQELVRHLALDEPFTSGAGAPGSRAPGHLAGADPLATWRAARGSTAAVLDGGIDRPAPPRYLATHPGATLADFLPVLTLDYLAHAWDIGTPHGLTVRLPVDLLRRTLALACSLERGPGMLGPALEPPADADEQARWLAALGRR